jgi:hypothetical protein
VTSNSCKSGAACDLSNAQYAHGPAPTARWLPLLALLASALLAASARSEPDDDDPDDPPKPMPVQTGFTDENLDQWIFQNNGNNGSGGARQQLDSMLALHLDDVDRACKLTDAQKKKLQLVGRGDIKRFYVLYDKVKQKFQLVKNDQQKMQEIWQEINPLQVMVQFGLYDDDSLFGRSLHNILTPEQLARYTAAARERRAAANRAQIELAVYSLELSMPLRQEQRRGFIETVDKLIKPPRRANVYGYMGHYYIMYQLARIPEEKIRPFFDDAQWKAVSSQFGQFRQFRPWLKQSGVLTEDDDEADKADPKPAAGKK